MPQQMQTSNTDKMSSLKLALFVLFTLAARSSEAATKRCGPCECYEGPTAGSTYSKIATCYNRQELTTLPADLPADIQMLEIYRGSISRLNDSQFTSYRLLQKIELNSNKIKQIYQGTFRYLTNLTSIQLNDNKIFELPTECFKFSPNLVRVELNDNVIRRLQSHLFSNLKYLEKVQLRNNEINTIEEHCFVKVPQLGKIYLNNNKLISLDIKFIDNPISLYGLFLDGNPWHCNKSLCGVMMRTVKSLELWTDKPAPTCTTPQNLTERQWSEPLLTDLCSCLPYNCDAPAIISSTSSVSGGQDLRLVLIYFILNYL